MEWFLLLLLLFTSYENYYAQPAESTAGAASGGDTNIVSAPMYLYLLAISDIPLVTAMYNSIMVSHPRRETRAEAVRDEIATDRDTYYYSFVNITNFNNIIMYTTRDTESESEDRANNRYNRRALHIIVYLILRKCVAYCVLDERG